MTRTCVDCGTWFEARGEWMTRCSTCYHAHRAGQDVGSEDALARAAARAVHEAYQAGHEAGYTAGHRDGYDVGWVAGRDVGLDQGLDVAATRVGPAGLGELLRDVRRLVHPDAHPPERFAQANDVTARLNAALQNGGTS